MFSRSAVAAVLTFLSFSVAGQDWSVGVASGPFVFGDFLERTVRPTTGDSPSGTTTIVLTAATRPGLAVDVERSLTGRFAVRLEGTFTQSPLSLEQEGASGSFHVDAGHLDVSTFMLPLVMRVNRRGAVRFHLLAGPALAFYRARARENVENAKPVFDGTRSEWGVAFGGGVGWWVSDRFAVEGNLTDTVTSSPIERNDLPDVPGYAIPRPHNVHTTLGVRYRF